ncbi:Protein of unknown function [Lactobacillus acidophilus DSM 20079 = JCM 1132 = NBRC 13951 = CIP 76.13]
MGYNL